MSGRDAASRQGSEHSSLRHAKYFPPSVGTGIGPGTKRRIIGSRKNFRVRLKCSSGGSRRNPYASGPLKTKSLLPSAMTEGSRFSVRSPCQRAPSMDGMRGRTVELYCVDGSAADAVSAETKQSRHSFAFISVRLVWPNGRYVHRLLD